MTRKPPPIRLVFPTNAQLAAVVDPIDRAQLAQAALDSVNHLREFYLAIRREAVKEAVGLHGVHVTARRTGLPKTTIDYLAYRKPHQ